MQLRDRLECKKMEHTPYFKAHGWRYVMHQKKTILIGDWMKHLVIKHITAIYTSITAKVENADDNIHT